jgi:hypothetical protein
MNLSQHIGEENMKTKIVFMMLLVAMTTMGFDCVNDNALVSVNITGVSGTYKINPGNNPAFDGSATVLSSDYADLGFSNVDFNTTRIYDIRVSTIGQYGGNVNGQVLVNGTQILSYNGSWASFNTPQSLVTSTLITRYTAGITTLVAAIRGKQNITLRGFGTVSQIPVPDGLSVKIEVFAQVDAEL